MVVTTVLRNIKDTGHPLRVKVWSLLTANVWQLAVSDLVMVTTSALVYPLQVLTRKGGNLLRWHRMGIVLQSIYQIAWLMLWIESVPLILFSFVPGSVMFYMHACAKYIYIYMP